MSSARKQGKVVKDYLRKARRGVLLSVVGIGCVAGVAVADELIADANKLVASTQSSGDVTRSGSGTGRFWLDQAAACNARTSNPVSVSVATAYSGSSGWLSSSASLPLSITACGENDGKDYPYAVSGTAPLGETVTVTGTPSGGDPTRVAVDGLGGADSFTLTVVPRAPGALGFALNGTSGVNLNWVASADAADITDYKISRTKTGGSTTELTAAKNATTYSDTGLDPSSQYCYRIRARYNAGGNDYSSSLSNQVCATTPAAPSDTTKPVITASATSGGSSYASGTWTKNDVIVSFTCADEQGGSGIKTNSVAGSTVSDETANGSVTNTGTCEDNVGNVANSVTFSGIKIDKTKPVITASATSNGNPYSAGDWTKHDVVVGFACSDGSGSGVANSDVAGDTVSAETSNGSVTNSGTCVDNAGNTADSATFSPITIDKTAPSITDEGPTAAPNGDNDWYTVDVINEFKASDSRSGLSAACDAAFDQTDDIKQVTISDEGSAVKGASGSCTDVAGNEAASIDSAAFKIDKTPPDTSVVGPEDASSYTLGSVPGASCSSTDTPSGLAVEATPNTTGGPVGSVTVTCSGAKDNAGNVNSTGDSVTFSVTYNWTGFFSPVDNGGVYNSVKAGSAVPVKFNLGGNQGLNILAAGYPTSTTIPCYSTASVDAIEQTVTAGQSTLQYDAVANQYVYVWKTDKLWAGTCRQLVVKLDDDTYHRANFKFLK